MKMSKTIQKLKMSDHFAILLNNFAANDILEEGIEDRNIINFLHVGYLEMGLIYPKGSPFKRMINKGNFDQKKVI